MYTDTKANRRALIADSKLVFFDFRLPVDLFNSATTFLPPKVNLQVRCTRNEPTYGIILEDGEVNTYKVRLESLKLITRKVVVSPFALERYNHKLSTQDAVMRFKTGRLRFFQIPKDLTSLNIPGVVTGQLPTSMLIGFVLADSYSGISKKDSFKFEGFDLSSLNVKVSGNNILSSPYKANFTTKANLMHLYKELLMNTGYAFNSQTIDITYDDFIDNKFFLAVDFTPDQCYQAHKHKMGTGDIVLELTWEKPLPDNIVCMTYANFDSTVRINNYQQVSVTF